MNLVAPPNSLLDKTISDLAIVVKSLHPRGTMSSLHLFIFIIG